MLLTDLKVSQNAIPLGLSVISGAIGQKEAAVNSEAISRPYRYLGLSGAENFFESYDGQPR